MNHYNRWIDYTFLPLTFVVKNVNLSPDGTIFAFAIFDYSLDLFWLITKPEAVSLVAMSANINKVDHDTIKAMDDYVTDAESD